MRWAFTVLILLNSNLLFPQKYEVVNDLRNYDFTEIESKIRQYDSFTQEMLAFQVRFLKKFNAYELEIDTLRTFGDETDPLGQFYFYINKGDYLFYAFDTYNVRARNEYVKAIKFAEELKSEQLVCEATKKLLDLYSTNYLNHRFVNPSDHFDTYQKYAYDNYERIYLKFYRLVFKYRNSLLVGTWDNQLANELFEFANNSNRHFLNARILNLLANYGYNKLKDYELAIKYNKKALENLYRTRSLGDQYGASLLRKVQTGMVRHNVFENRLYTADSILKRIDTVSMNSVDKYYKRYYFYYQSSIDTSNSNYTKAYDNYREYTKLSETYRIKNNVDALRYLEAEYKDQKQKEVISLQRRQLWLIGGMLLILVILSTLLYYAFANIRKKNLKIETLIRELHHRVKNNLQVISSLLGLQSMRLDDENAKVAVSESKSRIRAMSLIHQKLYQTDKIASLNINEYLTNLITELAQAHGYYDKAELRIEAPQHSIDPDTSLPLGLIVNEIVSNSFKYAYSDVINPILELKLEMLPNDRYSLMVRDNGKGLEQNFDIEKSHSFGMKLIQLLVKQLKGKMQIKTINGLEYHIEFTLQN